MWWSIIRFCLKFLESGKFFLYIGFTTQTFLFIFSIKNQTCVSGIVKKAYFKLLRSIFESFTIKIYNGCGETRSNQIIIVPNKISYIGVVFRNR